MTKGKATAKVNILKKEYEDLNNKKWIILLLFIRCTSKGLISATGRFWIIKRITNSPINQNNKNLLTRTIGSSLGNPLSRIKYKPIPNPKKQSKKYKLIKAKNNLTAIPLPRPADLKNDRHSNVSNLKNIGYI